MKMLLVIYSLLVVLGVGYAQAQQYEVAPSGTKNFTTAVGIAPGGSIDLDIYLTGVSAPQNAGGVWIDFSASTADLSYVSAGIASPPWAPPGPSVDSIIIVSPGVVVIVVGSLAGAPPDGSGNLIIGYVQLQNLGPGANPATVNFTTIPSFATWSPIVDSDVTPGQIVIEEVCDCTTDADCDDGLFCNGAEICNPICLCNSGTPPCDDGDECTLDCDEDADTCLTNVCDTSLLDSPTDPCCTNPSSPCSTSGADPQPICTDTDTDGDGIVDSSDNCPHDYNPLQEDSYPPEGNGIGDACDCEADFNCDGNVDAVDVTRFLADFGRNQFNNPCTDVSPCNGDINCDRNVDATDVTTFLQDFGRNGFNNPCPACVAGDWCSPYPPLFTGVEGTVYYSTNPLPDIQVSLLDGSTHVEITNTYSNGNGYYELFYDIPGYYCLHPNPPSPEYASIAYCASGFIQEGYMTPFDLDLPKKLTLTSPPHLGIISDTTPTLVWEANPLAVSYNVYVQDLSSQDVLVSQNGITSTSYTIPAPLPIGDYYWSVFGYDATDHLVGFGGAQFTIE